MNSDKEFCNEEKKSAPMWKAIFIILLIPLFVLNLQPIVGILDYVMNSTWTSIALLPFYVVSSTFADLIALLVYAKIYHLQSRTRIISYAALIVLSFVVIYLGFALYIYLRNPF